MYSRFQWNAQANSRDRSCLAHSQIFREPRNAGPRYHSHTHTHTHSHTHTCSHTMHGIMNMRVIMWHPCVFSCVCVRIFLRTHCELQYTIRVRVCMFFRHAIKGECRSRSTRSRAAFTCIPTTTNTHKKLYTPKELLGCVKETASVRATACHENPLSNAAAPTTTTPTTTASRAPRRHSASEATAAAA